MNTERLLELAALHAAGALDGQELQEYEVARRDAAPAVQAEIARLHDTAAALAFRAPAVPPPSLKARVLAAVRPSPPPARLPFAFVMRDEGYWQALPVPGVRMKELAADPARGTSVRLYELAPGAHFPHHHHSGPEECFVVSGDFHVEGRVLHGGDFHHADEHSDHGESYTEGGCMLLVMATSTDYHG